MSQLTQNDPVILHLRCPDYALMIWGVVGADRIDQVKSLHLQPKYGWTVESISDVVGAWELLRSGDLASINGILPQLIDQMMRLTLINKYSSRWISEAFEGIPTEFDELRGFTPPPPVGVLYASDRKPHYLDGAAEKREILLQAWIYCRFDERRFRPAVKTVWDQYAQLTKFEGGYGGEVTKFASALRTACDQAAA